MSAQLSVNINKYALLRNSRGHDVPNLLRVVDVVLAAGAHGITVHPRRDERHIHMADVPVLKAYLDERYPGVELNVECEVHDETMALVHRVRPAQVTLVPVTPGEVTSDHGYDLPAQNAMLADVIPGLREAGMRVSAFMDPSPRGMEELARLGAHRCELYTGPYAWAWGTEDQQRETDALFAAASAAVAVGLSVNAGHDLDRHNLVGLRGLPGLAEVSIGHAQICRALEVGTTQSVQELLAAL